jgi:hypothetical protein
MTVGELKGRMTYSEFKDWVVYFDNRNREDAKAKEPTPVSPQELTSLMGG